TGFAGLAQVEAADANAAIPHLQAAITELERFGFPQWHGMFTALFADAHRQQGQLDRAAELVARGIEITTRCGYFLGMGIGQRVLGRIARARGSVAEAETALTKALETFAAIDAAFEVARTRLELADLMSTRGHDAVPALLREAYRTFVDAAAPAYVRRAREIAAARGIALG